VTREEELREPASIGARKISLSDGLHGADPVLVMVNGIAR
jgi:hypothetical protein